jgi:hypothetical protein
MTMPSTATASWSIRQYVLTMRSGISTSQRCHVGGSIQAERVTRDSAELGAIQL